MPKDKDRLATALAEAVITDEEIMRVKGVTLSTVRRWGQQGKLPPKVGAGRKRGRNRKSVLKMLAGIDAPAKVGGGSITHRRR